MFIEDYCLEPQHRVLLSIRGKFGAKWKYVGYILGLEHDVIDNIELNSPAMEERCFRMLAEWIQRDVKSCYCKLISAMAEEHLDRGIEILKCKIKSSKAATCFYP